LKAHSICKLRSAVNACIDEAPRFTYHTKQSVVAIHEICGHAEHQERAGTIRTFGFTLSKALVTDERALLVVYESTKRQASKRPAELHEYESHPNDRAG
jgi:hypothetical protein